MLKLFKIEYSKWSDFVRYLNNSKRLFEYNHFYLVNNICLSNYNVKRKTDNSHDHICDDIKGQLELMFNDFY